MTGPADDRRVVPCRACGAPMIWARSPGPKGRAMPIDAVPDPRGLLMLNGHTVQYAGDAYEGTTYTSHFATCPHAATFRKDNR